MIEPEDNMLLQLTRDITCFVLIRLSTRTLDSRSLCVQLYASKIIASRERQRHRMITTMAGHTDSGALDTHMRELPTFVSTLPFKHHDQG